MLDEASFHVIYWWFNQPKWWFTDDLTNQNGDLLMIQPTKIVIYWWFNQPKWWFTGDLTNQNGDLLVI